MAHHSVLIVEAFGSIERVPAMKRVEAATETIRLSLQDMIDTLENLGKKNRLENLHDAPGNSRRRPSMFDLGLLDLRARLASRQSAGKLPSRGGHVQGMRYVPEMKKWNRTG